MKNKTWVSVNIICILLLPVLYFGNQAAVTKQAAKRIVSPIAMTAYADYAEPINVEQDTPQQQEIAAYVRQVFGVHASKAFQVLSCENSSLNPKAVNTAGNTPAGSRDIGIFQINEFHQDVNAKFLFNWRTNIHLAYQIYTENGSFERWSCGRSMGI